MNAILRSPAQIHENIAGSKLVVLAESGHMTFVDQPTMFVQNVIDFLHGK
jgi:pimeloyl-ACP methyl ester carboxylesterase